MAMTLITTNSDTNQTSMSFTSSIDSTYKLYIFKFININPATDEVDFQFNVSTDGGSNYNLQKTSTYFQAYHTEADDGQELTYRTQNDLANGTGDQVIAQDANNAADANIGGTLWLFNPSNTTYVKHFYSVISNSKTNAISEENAFSSGYVNSTSDVDAIIFRCSSGNFDGTIKMYGVG